MTRRWAQLHIGVFLALILAAVYILMPDKGTLRPNLSFVCANSLVKRMFQECANAQDQKRYSISYTRPVISYKQTSFPKIPSFQYGLDVRGGVELILSASMEGVPGDQQSQRLEDSLEILSDRLRLYGVEEYELIPSRSGDDYRIIVRLPTQFQSKDVVSLLGSTAKIEFKELREGAKPASTSGYLVSDFQMTALTGAAISSAQHIVDPSSNQPVINLQFSEEGTKLFAELTKRNTGKPLGVFIDGYPLTMPVVGSQISTGRAQINGNFTKEQAKSLTIAIQSGALPLSVEILSTQVTQPKLGEQGVRAISVAGWVAAVLIVAYMLFLYGAKGVFAMFSLLVYAVITLAVYKVTAVVITLPTMAGFLLSLGLVLDTHILIFERMREEERKMSSVAMILSHAFGRAWESIQDANVLTLFTCIILINPFSLSILLLSPLVSGFAISLAIGILLNLGIGMILTRAVMTLWYKPPNESEI